MDTGSRAKFDEVSNWKVGSISTRFRRRLWSPRGKQETLSDALWEAGSSLGVPRTGALWEVMFDWSTYEADGGFTSSCSL